MTSPTTIKVPKDLRDRISQQAAERGVTAAELLAQLLDERERQVRLAAVRAAYARRDVSYADEVEAWDVASADGLE